MNEQKPDVKVKSVEEIARESAAADLQLKELELQEKKALIADMKHRAEMRDLERQEKEASLVDLKERLDERMLKRRTREATFRGHGANLKQDAANLADKQKRCTHRKGGDGAAGVLGGQGDDTQYCIARHQMANGDIWVRCLRCGKTWKSPVKSAYLTDEAYKAAYEIYETALQFHTRNHTSGTHTFQWGEVKNAQGKTEGGVEFYREKMKNVTLT